MSALPSSSPAPTPSEVAWAALAPRLAARGRARVSRDGGKSYRLRDERLVSTALPNQPAAVLLYNRQGCAPVLAIDLDVSKAGPGGLEADFRSLTGLLTRAGLRSWFSDHSPNGGRHVYVPLAEPVPFSEAREAITLLAAAIAAIDPQPMLSVERGCIRPPGARHKTGGHQLLDGPLEHAVAALNAPNDALAWRRLLGELRRTAPPQAAATTWRRHHDEDASTQTLPALPGHSAPSEDFQAIARTGEYDPARFRGPKGQPGTDSEARQGVIWAAVAAGWSLVDVTRRIHDGTWPGLASFYARYSDSERHRALQRDWRRAIAFEKRRRSEPTQKPVRVCTTSPPKSQAPPAGQAPTVRNVSGFVREWLTAVDLLHGPDTDLSVRAVLYALAEAAVLTGRLEVEHGQRSLEIATGLHRTSVGRALKKLVDEPADRLLVDLVNPASRLRADVFRLRIPELLQPACSAQPWRRGRVHAIRPVFHELGLVAAFVYSALEQLDHANQGPVGGRELAAAARIGVTATYDALQILAAHGLVDRVDGGWKLGTASLAQLAEAWGLVEKIRETLARHRAERAAWRAWLVARGLIPAEQLAVTRTRAAPPPSPPPPEPTWFDDATGLLELLEQHLGATLVS